MQDITELCHFHDAVSSVRMHKAKEEMGGKFARRGRKVSLLLLTF